LESVSANISYPAQYSRLAGFLKLTKFRLGSLVVFSAVITYLTITPEIHWQHIVALGLGGFLVTSAANGFNQIIEKEEDKRMERTRNRPLPIGVISPSEAFIFCTTLGIAGITMLWSMTNALCGILGFVSIILYAMVYTPLKKITPFSVFAGAFPGALPTLIGGVAATEGFGQIGFPALLLFLIQFVWQFPHFWSLAWFNHEDYSRAGFQLLPSRNGKDVFSRFQILIYSFFLLFTSMLPFVFHQAGLLSTIACALCGLAMLLQAYNFFRLPTDENARRLFFVTLVYLPLVQIALMTHA
jgi:protoheme IX farnesyltransferase